MTPAEWLAALILGWQIVGGIWDLLDPNAARIKYKTVRLLATLALLLTTVVLASIVLFGTAWAGVTVVLVATIIGLLREASLR